MRAFFYEAFEEEREALRKSLPQGCEPGFTERTVQESGHQAPPCRLISVRTQSEIPASWAPALEGVLSRSTGFDRLRSWRRQVAPAPACGYLPRYCALAVAEHALLVWLALLRKLPRQTDQFRRFHRDGLTGRECAGRRLLVIGVGNIGYEAVRLGAALQMNVFGADLVRRHGDVRYTDAAEGLRQADVIVCAMNLTEENAGYFSYARLRELRPGAIFVNVARGEMAPAADLLRAYDEGILGGIGLDVYDRESELAVCLRESRAPADPGGQALLELARRPNVILTPHNAFNTQESVERKSRQSAEQVVHFLDQGRFLWPVPD